MRNSRFVGRFLRTTMLTGVAAAMAVPAFAQDEDDTIIVTGSRIPRAEIQASSPINVVGQEDILLSGRVNVEDVLNEIPALAPDLGSNTNNGGSGIATVDLRALGANRTLILVNGRRWVASDDEQQVDINNIPAALIERVEVVTGGASSVYGSDAIAGAINFIMKDDFEGVRVGGQHNVTTRGDGGQTNANVTIGGNFADGRGNVTVFADYFKRQEVLAAARDYSDTAYDDLGGGTVLDPLGSSRIPGSGVYGTDLIVPGEADPASSVGFLADGTPFGGPDSFNFQPTNFIQSPQERVLISGFGRYEINDSVEAYMEIAHSTSRVNQQLAFDANDIPDAGPLFVTIAGNPLITNPDLITFLTDNFDVGTNGDVTAGDGLATIPDLRRRMVEVGPRFTSFDLHTLRVAGGLRGDLPSVGSRDDWSYDLFFSYGTSNITEQLLGYTSDVRIQQAVLVEVDADTGLPACTNPAGGCVPISLFGPDSITDPDALAFIAPTALVQRETEQLVAAANIAGSLFEVPAGTVMFAGGLEYRSEESRSLPDEFVQSGELGPGNDEAPVAGDFDVFEGFAEFLVPVVADKEWAELIELEGAVRVADYSSVGTNLSFKGGGSWTVGNGLKLRGLYQRAVRAPNLFELFGQATGAISYTDACAAAQTNGDAAQEAFCLSQGVPDPATFAPDAQAQTTNVGAAILGTDLSEETAKTWTVGFVYEPEWIEGLTVIADYYNIDLEDAIDTLSPTTITTQCVESLDLASQACSQITRRLNGDIQQIFAPFVNLGAETRTGIDWQINYDFDLGVDLLGPTSVSFVHLGNYTMKNEFTPTPDSDLIDCNGIFDGDCSGLGDFNQPEWRMTNNLSINTGPLTVRTQVRLLGGLTNGLINDIDDLAFPSTPTYAYVDLALDYQVNDNVKLYAGAENLTDIDPPRMGFGFTGRNGGSENGTDLSLYEGLGTRVFFGAVLEF